MVDQSAFAAFGCSWKQIAPSAIEDCRIVVRHRLMEIPGFGTSAVTFVEWGCSFLVAAVVDSVAGTWHSSGIGGWQSLLEFLVGKENRGAIEMVARE